METVEEGVANFKLFQTDMRRFVTTFEANEKVRERTDARRSRIHYSLLALLCGLIVALFTFILNHYDGKRISFDIHDQSQRKDFTGDSAKRYTADKNTQQVGGGADSAPHY